MARQRDRVRVARVLRALLVAVLGSLAATTLFEQDLGRDLVVPLWAVTWAPPAFYLLLALVALRHTPAGRRLGWAVATCGVNAGLGLTTALALSFAHPMSFPGAFIRALWTFAPAPAIHLLVAPLVMFAWRSRVRPRMTIQLDRSATPPLSRPAAPPLPTATPNWDAVLHETAPSFDPGPAPFERVARQPEPVAPEPVPAPAPAPVPVAAAPSPAPPLAPTPAHQPEPPRPMAVPFVAPPPPPADEPLMRISFDRIAVQLPPDVFVLPPARLAESLREPLVLTVPSRHVLPHLAEGAIDIPWAVIEYQFPEMAFALPQAEVRRRFAGWHLSLPMDEVLRQAPPDLWRVHVPAPDLTALTQFPAPFTPGQAAPSSKPAPAVAAAAPRTPPPVPAPPVVMPTVEPVVAETPAVSERPISPSARVSVPPVPVAAPSEPVAAPAPAAAPPTLAAAPAAPVVAAPTAPAPVAPPAAPVAAVPVAPAAPVVAPRPVAPVAAPAPAPVAAPAPAPVAPPPSAAPVPTAAVAAASPAAAIPPPPAAAPIAQPSAIAPAKAVSPSPIASRAPVTPPAPIASAPLDEESAALARALSLCLSPLGALEWQTRRVDGRILVSFVAPALAREAIDALASRATTLAGRLGRWPVDQLTIRTSRVVCILTPLGARGWLAASVRGGGPVALVELLSSRARSATANTGGVDPGLGEDDALSALSPSAGPLVSANGSVAAATRVLTAFGSIVASTAAPEAGGPSVYAFAADSDRTLVGVARLVHTALVVGHDDDALGRIESVALRRGRERAIVRPLRGMGGPAVLAAAGQVVLPGRAHRAAVKAAALLEAK